MSVIDERGKRVITEQEVHSARSGDTIKIDEGAILTPLAADLARERGVQIDRVTRRTAANRRRIAIAADHGGVEMEEELKGVLTDLGYEFQEFGKLF